MQGQAHARKQRDHVSKPIIAAIRQRRDLKESVLHTAQELAYIADIYGTIRTWEIPKLASHCRCSPRTIQRHVAALEAARILRVARVKRRVRIQVGEHYETRIRYEKNVYTFIIPWRPTVSPKVSNATMAQTSSHTEREKSALSLKEEIAQVERNLCWHRSRGATGIAYEVEMEKHARLTALAASKERAA